MVFSLFLGGDIGGSIRIPALYNGIVGLKPTVRRVTIKGANFPKNPVSGNVNIIGSLGPMARSCDDLELTM
jgi:amidase